MFKFTMFYWAVLVALTARVTVFVRVDRDRDLASASSSAIYEVALIALGFIVFLVSPERRLVFQKLFSSPIAILFLYYILCVFSSFWSFSTVYTGVRSVEIVCLMLICAAVMNRYQGIDAERIFVQMFAVLVLIFIAMHIRNGVSFSLAAYHTNSYTAIAAAGFVYCYAELKNATGLRSRFLKRYGILFLACVALGTSSASIIACFLGFLCVNILSGSRGSVVLLFIGALAGVLYLSGVGTDLFFDVFFPNKSIEQITTLRGRIFLWEAYWQIFQDAPFIGNGAFIVARIGENFGIVDTTNLHNGYLEVLLGTGLLGAVVFLLWMFNYFSRLVFVRPNNDFYGRIGIIGASVVFLANNMSKSIVGGAFDPTLIAFLVLASYAYISPKLRVQSN